VRELQQLIERRVFRWPSGEDAFNPFADRLVDADKPRAQNIRRANLRRYLNSFSERPEVFVLGEAAGPWGCRFSGVPFTSEQQLCSGDLPFAGEQSSAADLPHAERSATIFWKTMAAYHPHFFVWNAMPLLPHRREKPFLLRRPDAEELRAFRPLLTDVIRLLNPVRMIAVGRVAEQALRELDFCREYVRHPSHGGQKEFDAGMKRIFHELAGTGKERLHCAS
jgi:hypothetical protein